MSHTGLEVEPSATAPAAPNIDDSKDLFSTAISTGASGSGLLSKLLSEGNVGGVEFAVKRHFDIVADGEFEWIRDLREAGCSTEEIVNCLIESAEPSLIESVESSPWTWTSEDFNLETHFTNREIKINNHLRNCIHIGTVAKGLGPFFDQGSHSLSDDREFNIGLAETVRSHVAMCCGLAGIFPPDRQDASSGWAIFNRSEVRIGYGSKSTDDDEREVPIPISHLRQILNVTWLLSTALRSLQDQGFCCDRVTILVKDEAGVVHMRHILFEDVRHYIEGLQNVWASSASKFKDQLHRCAQLAMAVIQHSLDVGRNTTVIPSLSPFTTSSENLHICALFTQLMSICVLSYSQAHTGELWPDFLREPLKSIVLEGYTQCRVPKLIAKFEYQELGCMSGLVGDKVLVLELSRSDSSPEGGLTPLRQGDIEDSGLLVGSIEDIIDSWGPGVLISDPGAQYGERVHSVMIGSGSIALHTPKTSNNGAQVAPIYHWGRIHKPAANMETFSIREPLTIGAITIQTSCPLDPQQCRRVSQPYLNNLGTEEDSWRLQERQMLLQGGQYIGLQFGNVYSKMTGRSLKTAMLDIWHQVPDFRFLLRPWGLQVSLCTGVARRVPLKTLIEEPMFAFIDGLPLEDWDAIRLDVRSAFNGTIDHYMEWTTGLAGGQRDCLIRVITIFLEALKDTGVDREGSELRMLWPHALSLSHAISLKCSKSNLWARVLKDSPSCATFAAVTSKCLEAPDHGCKGIRAPIWDGQGALLSTAVSRVSIPGALGGPDPAHWELKHGQQCWIEKVGGDIWVYTTKEPNSDTQLRVKINRLPKGLSIFRDWQVLREKQDATFEAENVVVFGTMA